MTICPWGFGTSWHHVETPKQSCYVQKAKHIMSVAPELLACTITPLLALLWTRTSILHIRSCPLSTFGRHSLTTCMLLALLWWRQPVAWQWYSKVHQFYRVTAKSPAASNDLLQQPKNRPIGGPPFTASQHDALWLMLVNGPHAITVVYIPTAYVYTDCNR